MCTLSTEPTRSLAASPACCLGHLALGLLLDPVLSRQAATHEAAHEALGFDEEWQLHGASKPELTRELRQSVLEGGSPTRLLSIHGRRDVGDDGDRIESRQVRIGERGFVCSRHVAQDDRV